MTDERPPVMKSHFHCAKGVAFQDRFDCTLASVGGLFHWMVDLQVLWVDTTEDIVVTN